MTTSDPRPLEPEDVAEAARELSWRHPEARTGVMPPRPNDRRDPETGLFPDWPYFGGD
jgi:hypothetical protein